ncbi:MAG: hypothetical protein M3Y54_22270 [Bacteroidota bacterium]|nr:hypothetical protein [Bacteroidota bacterium]
MSQALLPQLFWWPVLRRSRLITAGVTAALLFEFISPLLLVPTGSDYLPSR